MGPILLRVPRHPHRWLGMLALQQLLFVLALTSGYAVIGVAALVVSVQVVALRLRPRELALGLDPEERALKVGNRRRSLAGAASVRVGLRVLGRVEIEDAHGRSLIALGGLDLPHAKWVAHQLSEHFGLALESTEDTARAAVQAPLTEGFLEKILDVPSLNDAVGRAVPALLLLALWAKIVDGNPSFLLAAVLSAVFALALGLMGARRSQRVRFTADRVESTRVDVLGRAATTVLRASELLSAQVVPGWGAVPTVILADRQGQRIELARIDRRDLEEVVACVERMRTEVAAIPEAPPEPEALRRMRAVPVHER